MIEYIITMFDQNLAFDRSIDQAQADAGDVMKQLHTARGVQTLWGQTAKSDFEQKSSLFGQDLAIMKTDR